MKGCLYIAIYANFSEKGCLYIAIYANFSKREKEWIGRPAGKQISPRPSSVTEIIGNCLPVSQTSHFSQKSSEFDIFALEANTLFLLLEIAAIE